MKKAGSAGSFAAGLLLGTGFCLLLFTVLTCVFLRDHLGRILGSALAPYPKAQSAVLLALKSQGQIPVQENSLFAQYGYDLQALLPFFSSLLAAGLLFLTGSLCLVLLLRRRRRTQEQQQMEALLQCLHSKAAESPSSGLSLEQSPYAPLQRQLKRTLLNLQSSQEALVREKGQFAESLASIAHQLKTPTASLRLMAEMLSPKLAPDLAPRMKKQLARLSSLEESLLTLARLDHGTLCFHAQPLSLDGLVQSALDLLEEQAQKKQVQFEALLEPASFCSDPEWTLQALLNLLKNALDYAPEGSTVRVQLKSFPLAHQLLIEDEGPGVSADDLPRLFERYYRSRHASQEGCGIGLPLARELLEAQNASLSVHNRPQGGLACDIRFYRS